MTNRFKIGFVAALIFAMMAACSPQGSEAPAPEEAIDLVVRNVTIVGGGAPFTQSGADVLIAGGEIVSIVEHQVDRDSVSSIDGTGKFLVPGYMDAHTHPFPVERTFSQFVEHGVTSILVTGCSACSDKNLSEIRSQGDDSSHVSPRVFHTSQHFSMEGRHPVKTYPSPRWVEGETVFYIRQVEDIEGLVARIADKPNVGIKLTIEKGPRPPFVDPMPAEFVNEVVAKAHQRDLKVLIHVSDIDGLEVAHAAGADHLLHYTGVDLDWQKHGDLVDDLVARDLHWVTTLMLDKSFLYPMNPDWIGAARETGLFDDELDRATELGMSEEAARRNAMIAYGEPEPTFASNPVLQKQFTDLLELHDRGIKLVTGTDVGNRYILPGYSLHEEMLLLEEGGFMPSDILKMTTLNAAELVGAADRFGSIEAGKVADLVLLNSDPRVAVQNFKDIELVLKGGNVIAMGPPG